MLKIANSDRLCFELMTAKDAPLLFELDQCNEVMQYINGGIKSTMKDIEEIMLPRMEKYRDESKGWGVWKVSLISDKSFIGWILIRPMNFFNEEPEWDNLEIGWRFKKIAWGKGYATEAANSIKDGVIVCSSPRYFSALADPNNLGSIRIMEKLGMEYVKQYVHKDPLGDHESVLYQMSVC